MTGEKLLAEMPPAPRDIKAWVLRDIVKGNYMIYSNSHHKAACTRCGSVFDVRDGRLMKKNGAKLHHKGEIVCPNCRAESTAQAYGKGRKHLEEQTRILVFVKRGKEVYASLSDIDISFEGWAPEVYLHLSAIYKFSTKGSWRFDNVDGWYSCGWVHRKKISLRACSSAYNWYSKPKREDTHVYTHNFDKVFKGTCLQYADIPVLWGIFSPSPGRCMDAFTLIRYIDLSVKYPIIEQMRKVGLMSLVLDKINECGPSSAVNWRAKNLRAAMRMTMPEIHAVAKAGIGLDELGIMRKRKEAGDPCSPEIAERLTPVLGRGAWMSSDDKTLLEEMTEYASISRIGAYVVEQDQKEKTKTHVTFKDYMDYFRECKKLGFNLRDKKILFPAAFRAAHKRTSDLVDQLKDQIDQAGIDEAVAKITGMNEPYRKGGLLIRPARSAQELRDEGRILGHCVGGYAEKMTKGQCVIMFIRKTTAPDKPFFTLELSPNRKVMQCRGEHNCSAPEEVNAFVDSWMSWLLSKWSKVVVAA